MRCPFCEKLDNKVIDSRLSNDGESIRRRRECLECKRRFTTYERSEQALPLVIKKDGRRETFNRNKILAGLQKACEKRPVSIETLQEIVERITRKIQELGESEIPSHRIGQEVMEELYRLDQVAYVRFASVYRDFKDLHAFMAELKSLIRDDHKEPVVADPPAPSR
ncbi:MAG TPA: transcriptional regulator NrdR [Nitrospiria bacterium]|nr:transcriptional regulator NrdR [Nitrospiria bacterium]